MNTNVDDLMRKTKSYWYEDGLTEILAGAFFFVIGLLLLVDWATPQSAPFKWMFAPGFMVVTIVWILSGRRVIDAFKERITYPRTGYVAYKQQPRRTRLLRGTVGGFIGAAVALVVVASLMYRQDIVRLAPVIMAAGVAALLFRIGSEVAVARFYVLAAWSLAVGCALVWLIGDFSLTVALYYALLGLAILVLGGVTLMRYLRAAAREGGND